MSAEATGFLARDIKRKLENALNALRAKKREILTEYQQEERHLMRSVDLDTAEGIIQSAVKHFRAKQEHDLIIRAVTLADELNGSPDFLHRDFNGDPDTEQDWKELCSMQQILHSKELDELIDARHDPPVEQKTIQELTHREAPGYVRNFLEFKDSTQTMNERMQELFPISHGSPGRRRSNEK